MDTKVVKKLLNAKYNFLNIPTLIYNINHSLDGKVKVKNNTQKLLPTLVYWPLLGHERYTYMAKSNHRSVKIGFHEFG
jgi:hypothetical protein